MTSHAHPASEAHALHGEHPVHGEHVAHHFDDAQQQFQAAQLGMWLFLATEVLFFGGAIAGYAQYRYWFPEAWSIGSHQLDRLIGTVNTTVLLGSSLCMALAVHAAQAGTRKVFHFLAGTLGLGLVFLGVKAYEYAHKFHEGLVPGSLFTTAHLHLPQGVEQAPPQVELFFSFYFVMTGLHAFHMVIGAGLLIWLMVGARHNKYTPDYFTPVEMVGLYWHFVDIVWVFLFPLLYLVG